MAEEQSIIRYDPDTTGVDAPPSSTPGALCDNNVSDNVANGQITDMSEEASAVLEYLLNVSFRGAAMIPVSNSRIVQKRFSTLLELRILQDFTLKCQSLPGAEWKIHVAILIAGSQALQEESLHKVKQGLKFVEELSLECHPMLINRYKAFMYTGSYHLNKGGKALRFHYVDNLPTDFTPEAWSLKELSYVEFHFNMYNLGEFFRDYDLLTHIRHVLNEKLVLKHDCRPKELSGILDTLYKYSPCRDHDGMLRAVVLAGVFAHQKAWGRTSNDEFARLVSDNQLFNIEWEAIKMKFKKVLATADAAKRQFKKMRVGG
ncbi:hypothetical protein K491DRAFT_784657 [Lophiostoma macrostomum CBS 122681]|uniref:BTB domain-containing protein n=1 Tax=Lophiostoma macrostomum CBS 122681 TaxID=1314788 RepID=A0A6A6SI76_9PLEO|nr:hypothetical protein K491DRAFT_784657 [Lophiostoma macrostomum CBS 122681]